MISKLNIQIKTNQFICHKQAVKSLVIKLIHFNISNKDILSSKFSHQLLIYKI